MGDGYTQGQVKHNGAWSPHGWVTVTHKDRLNTTERGHHTDG